MPKCSIACFVSEEGVCTVVAADREYREVGTSNLDERTLGSFAAVGNALIVRTERYLLRIE